MLVRMALICSVGMLGGCFQTFQPNPLAEVRELVAVVRPTTGNQCTGVVRFLADAKGVRVVADIEGLIPGAQHGFHIHEFGDATKTDGTSAGGHYSPHGHEHGLTDHARRHAGDLGNLQADAAGKAHYDQVFEGVSLFGHDSPVLGRGVIVHAKPDDGGQPTGNAGPRIGIGVIGIAGPR